jgi:hypothetical protein
MASFVSEAVGLRAIHQRASVVRYAEFGELHCKLGHAVQIEPGLRSRSPKNGNTSNIRRRLPPSTWLPAKERTPQAGWGRERQLGGRIKGSHKLKGGGDRVRLSRELERDAIEAGLVNGWQHSNAKRKADRKEYRKRPLTARAPRLAGQILLFPEMKPVARLQAFGGGYIPRAVASEIEFRRQKRGLSQRQLAALVGRSQGQLANALRGHDPISARVVNRLRDALLT